LEYNTGNKSKAQEKGISFITGDVVIMTDADTILDKNFVKNTEKRFL
jgi:cellulose synthase/poly-beta-1,6-N-acetylglucosamine synthase-like glycosyltransferase